MSVQKAEILDARHRLGDGVHPAVDGGRRRFQFGQPNPALGVPVTIANDGILRRGITNLDLG